MLNTITLLKLYKNQLNVNNSKNRVHELELEKL